MKKTTVYIAGKVTGTNMATTTATFKAKQQALESQGYNVINPVELINQINRDRETLGARPVESWEDAMKRCLSSMLLNAQEVHLLPCWRDSRGAIIEHDIARKLGLKIIYPGHIIHDTGAEMAAKEREKRVKRPFERL